MGVTQWLEVLPCWVLRSDSQAPALHGVFLQGLISQDGEIMPEIG